MRAKTRNLALILCMLLSVAAIADDMHGKDKDMMSMMGEMMTFSGKIVCLGCTLKAEGNAQAACKEFGHHFVLKTDDGKMIELLENRYSKDLAGEMYVNKMVEVTGNYFANANTLDVQSYKAEGKSMAWCDHHMKMDGCMAK